MSNRQTQNAGIAIPRLEGREDAICRASSSIYTVGALGALGAMTIAQVLVAFNGERR
jgi:hypothetical protein